jgi:hypothetical protein
MIFRERNDLFGGDISVSDSKRRGNNFGKRWVGNRIFMESGTSEVYILLYGI